MKTSVVSIDWVLVVGSLGTSEMFIDKRDMEQVPYFGGEIERFVTFQEDEDVSLFFGARPSDDFSR